MKNNIIQPLKGFRDFLPIEASKRLWLKDKLVNIFEQWGYEPLETPTLEPAELFENQVGEGEQLYYKFKDLGDRNVMLRYDQTVPTCRVVSQYFDKLVFPFKRYQIQSAFRAENTQKGRYREFVQCDADIFGVKSEFADAEVIALSLDIFQKLGFKDIRIAINDRFLMKDFPYEAISAIDKLKKIGDEGVIKEMVSKGISENKAKEYLQKVKELKPSNSVQTIINYLEKLDFPKEWYFFEPTLARSLSYSSGIIWEVEVLGYEGGSVLGGERYDNLVNKISGVEIPAVGFGLGFDRTLAAMERFGLIPEIKTKTKVLVAFFSEDLIDETLKIYNELRNNNIYCEIYPESLAKIEKQIKYADKKGIQYVLILGPEELKSEKITLKNLLSREQKTLPIPEIFKILS
jgi:histidyl-tRNA synthetase